MVIWLTGCSSGLGRALAERLAGEGHVVAGCARRGDRIASLRSALPETNFFEVCDVSSDEDALGFCKAAYDATGAPDLVINNAAMINPSAPLWKISAEEFDALMSVNLSGTANIIRHALPIMMKAGKGVVVNMSSGWGRSVSPEVAPYCASKWGIEGLSKALAEELPEGLAVVALNPGVIDTAMLRSCFGEGAEACRTPAEWAETAAPFLLALGAKDNGASLTAP